MQIDCAMNLLPKDGHFYELLKKQITVLRQASEELEAGLKEHTLEQRFPSLTALEKKGDELLRETIRHLAQTFLTPFEPEQVQMLARRLDDVLDAIEEAGFRIVSYHLQPVPPEITQMAEIVRESCQCLQSGIDAVIRGTPAVSECRSIGGLESKTDQLSRRLVSELFAGPSEVRRLLEMKEVIEALEQITDRCEDVADALEDISRQWGKNR